jgi:ATP-dependent Clp endopeptidase proteolytic subunit ClpP
MRKKSGTEISSCERVPLDDELPIIWVSEFNQDTAQTFIKSLMAIEANPTISEIFIFITSYGGELYPCLAMVDVMNSCKKIINTVSLGISASAGGVLLANGTKGYRWISESSLLHIHLTQLSLNGTTTSTKTEINFVKNLDKKLTENLLKNSKITKKDFEKLFNEAHGEWCISPEEALKYGFVDRIGIPKFKKYEILTVEE